MPPNAHGASDGSDAENRHRDRPRVALARLREQRGKRRGALDHKIMEATLLTCGDLGYRHTTVEKVVERYGGYRTQFYSHFASLEECFATAYEEEAENLCEAILRAGGEAPDWHQGVRAALDLFAAYVDEHPAKASALLIDVHVAGGPAMDLREKLFERLARAIDSARRDTKSRHVPPPLTAAFMVNAVGAVAVSTLSTGYPQRLADTVPELVSLIVVAYFGDEGEPATQR